MSKKTILTAILFTLASTGYGITTVGEFTIKNETSQPTTVTCTMHEYKEIQSAHVPAFSSRVLKFSLRFLEVADQKVNCFTDSFSGSSFHMLVVAWQMGGIQSHDLFLCRNELNKIQAVTPAQLGTGRFYIADWESPTPVYKALVEYFSLTPNNNEKEELLCLDKEGALNALDKLFV